MTHTDFKKLGLSILIVIICIGILGGTYYAGFVRGSQETKHIVVEGVQDPVIARNGVDFRPFWEAWSILKEKFVSQEQTSNNQALLYGAINGLVDSLGDPNTNFFVPQEAEDFTQEISGQFSGIGAEIGADENGNIVIIAPLKDTPAFKAGVQAGDRVITIDDTDTRGLRVDEAVDRIRGNRGTQVRLGLMRDTKEITLTITRDIIELPTLEWKRYDVNGNESSKGDIMYIRLYNFYEKAPSQFYQAAIRAAGEKSKGIIIDLRGNPGGYLEAAIQIAGWFVPKGEVVVREEFKNSEKNQSFTSSGPAALKNVPVVVLIDKGSASASEILTGALKEKNNALVIGEKSFGKGTVQELVPLYDDSMLKVTIAHWLTPNGVVIDKNGIVPDISLETPSTTEELMDDPWLTRALKEMTKKIR